MSILLEYASFGAILLILVINMGLLCVVTRSMFVRRGRRGHSALVDAGSRPGRRPIRG